MLWLALALASAGCDERPVAEESAYVPSIAWDTARVRLVSGADTVPLRVELAVTPEQQTMGLMERTRLADDAGMLFVYDAPQPARSGFWMYRTRIPLDIAFADADGVIRAIRRMEPCPTTIPEGCPLYEATVPYQYALEVNAGFFARHGLGVGSRLLLADLPRAASDTAASSDTGL